MRRILFTLSIIVAITSFFSGCATYRFSSDLVGFDENSNKGMIIGSITFYDLDAKFNMYVPKIVSLLDEKSSEFIIQPNGMVVYKHWGELQEGKTYLFAITKKPGDYEINQIRCHTGNFQHYIKKFSIPFNVKKGEIVYIGEINIDEHASKSDTLIHLKNEFKRDIAGFKQKSFKSKINWDLVKQSENKIIYK
ncbi:MAG: hypothetical protein JNJ52_01355 [Flavobacterium sp.]|nr:hypothetical protein [Flavobacterium sp.]